MWGSRVLLLSLLVHSGASYLIGSSINCTQDTDALRTIKSLRQYYPCVTCTCEAGKIKCRKRCPKLDGCYRLIRANNDRCSCNTCQGCTLSSSNTTLVHGGLTRDLCSVQSCESGVITATDLQCHVPCAAPLPPPPGECCPACSGCRVEGHMLREGETVPISTDSCVMCRCLHNSLVCTKQACPVLSCPVSKRQKMPGECCSVCIGTREPFTPLEGHCVRDRYLHYDGSTSSVDTCTSCTCTSGQLVCNRQSCTPLTCPTQYQVPPEASGCCPSCEYPEVNPVCVSQGQVHQHNDTWRLGACASCGCSHGQVTCQVDVCPDSDKPCPVGEKREDVAEECCSRCVRHASTCLAYGAPHYRTYDGKHYDFQGDCKYTLTKDCGRRSKFRVKIINHSHGFNSVMPFTRSLVVKLHLEGYKIRVTMMVSRRTKVNGSRVRLPYRHRKDVLVIEKLGHGIQLNTTMGLRLLWDGLSYIEVELSPQWHNKTCGLCGNFNGLPADDLQKGGSNRRVAAGHTEVARTWARGQCSRKDRMDWRGSKRGREQRLTFCSSPSEATKSHCEPFQAPELQSCRDTLPAEPFHKACIEDMCRCKEGQQCQCSSMMAYIRECQRMGGMVPSWRNTTNCGGLECPHGAVYMECAPACRPTCRNPSPHPDCHTQRCLPGCYCPPPTVLHRGSCILATQCYKTDVNKHRRRRNRTRNQSTRGGGSKSRARSVVTSSDVLHQAELSSARAVP